MSAEPTVSDARGRQKVREVLMMAPGFGFSMAALRDSLNELLMPAEVEAEQLRRWIEWNHARDYVETKRNEDFDIEEWFITRKGAAKERSRGI